MSIQEGGIYRIVNVKGGTVLDLSGTDNESIIGWEWHGHDNQKWKLNRRGEEWVIENVNTGKFLGFWGDSQSLGDGSRLVAVDNPQGWDIWPDEDNHDVFRIFVHNTSLNIDLTNYGNPTNGTPVELWGKWEAANQTWQIEEA